MTDKEVSKLNRRDLLELLLETQTENETLQKNCEELKKQLVVLRDALKKSEDALRQNEDELRRAKGVSASADWQATALLKEARETADSVAATQREQHVAQEQLLQEREKRLQEREDYLNRQEMQLSRRLREAAQEAERVLAEARQTAAETRRTAEADAVARTRSAEEAAADTLRQAFWQDVNAALLRQASPDKEVPDES